eukprot:jgi/Chlat1/2641/Chrsp178S02480
MEVRLTFGATEVPIYKTAQANTWRALLPTSPLDVPGIRYLTASSSCVVMRLQVRVEDGRHRPLTTQVEVLPRTFPLQHIWLTENKSGRAGTSHEWERVLALRATRTPKQHWIGSFIQPNNGVITTQYGLQRFYNGVFAENYYHRGVDYGSDQGDPVVAPQAGQVVLVGKESEGFEVHGNCVGVDHGHGVTSIMMHLDEISVREGDFVKPGDRLGTVGETGVATGPHLHWGLFVNGECVDPQPWMERQHWAL